MLMNIGEGSVIILLECMLIGAHLLYNRSHSTIAKHLLILSKLLTMKEPSIDGPKTDPSSLSRRILRYVVATCYPKMIHRLGHRTLSKPYIQSLNQVTTFRYDKSMFDKGLTAEIESDRLFLVEFMLSASSRLHIKFPKIMEQAKL